MKQNNVELSRLALCDLNDHFVIPNVHKKLAIYSLEKYESIFVLIL